MTDKPDKPPKKSTYDCCSQPVPERLEKVFEFLQFLHNWVHQHTVVCQKLLEYIDQRPAGSELMEMDELVDMFHRVRQEVLRLAPFTYDPRRAAEGKREWMTQEEWLQTEPGQRWQSAHPLSLSVVPPRRLAFLDSRTPMKLCAKLLSESMRTSSPSSPPDNSPSASPPK